MHNLQVNPIVATTNYSEFEFLDDNREVKPNRVQKLIASIQTNGDRGPDFPIIVEKVSKNGRTVKGIRSGQHRFVARRELKLPIFYKYAEQKYTSTELGGVERATSSWSTTDSMTALLKEGHPEFIKLRSFLKKHDLPFEDDGNGTKFSAIEIFLHLVTKNAGFNGKVSEHRTGASSRFMESVRTGTYVHPTEYDEELAELLSKAYHAIRVGTGPVRTSKTLVGQGAGRIMKALLIYCEALEALGLPLKSNLARFIKRAAKTDHRYCSTNETMAEWMEENHNRNEKDPKKLVRLYC